MTILLGLMGGLALFLYGLQMTSAGLEAVAGDRLKKILEKLTSNRFLGIFVGMIITAAIQSSSATTVMVVGFVNASMMTLRQAVWVIMGANIGTTITGQLIALDIGEIAPLIAFIGVVLTVFTKKVQMRFIGQILAGLGILFLGMNMMSSAMVPLRTMPQFVDIVTNFSNPLVGILVGAGFTALIQSSSASVGIMQALALSGVLGLHQAVYVLFGQNIGTCITAVLASLGASREAKQTTVIHLSFNIIGTIIFTLICMLTPLTDIVISWTPTNGSQQIANMHTLFNVVTTLLLVPFGTLLADFATRVLPLKEEDKKSDFLYIQPITANTMRIGMGAVHIHQINDEVLRMMNLAFQNVEDAFRQLLGYSDDRHEEIKKREDLVDHLNEGISQYISEALTLNNQNSTVIKSLSAFFSMLVDLERISDYSRNVSRQARKGHQKDLTQVDIAMIHEMIQTWTRMQECMLDLPKANEVCSEVHRKTHEWRAIQIQEIKDKQLASEAGVTMSRIFSDFMRINDHAENVAEQFDHINLEALDLV